MTPDDIHRLVQTERNREGFSQREKASLWAGIESAMGPSFESPDSPEPSPQPSPSPSPSSAPSSLGPWKTPGLVLASVLGGAVIGALAHAQWREPRVVVIERQAAAPPISVTTSGTGTATETVSDAAAPFAERPREGGPTGRPEVRPSAGPHSQHPSPEASPARTPSTSAPPKDAALARERTLLDMARTALSRGDAAAALDATNTHAREFSTSQLSEEREALAIQALAFSQRLGEARQRASIFRANFPRSVLLPIVEEATQ